MAPASGFDVRRMIFQVHVNRPLQTELAVFHRNRISVLGNPIDRAIESPIKDDARGFAMESRIVLTLERARRLFSSFGQFASAIEARSSVPAAAARDCSSTRIG